MDNIVTKECFVCHKFGRIKSDNPNSIYNTIPVVHCFTKTVKCCNKYIYVHDSVQQDPNIVFDCEKKINKKNNDAYKNGICLLCKTSLYLRNYESKAIFLLALFLMLYVGYIIDPKTSLLVQIWIVIGIMLGSVCISSIIIVVRFYYHMKDMDVLDGSENE